MTQDTRSDGSSTTSRVEVSQRSNFRKLLACAIEGSWMPALCPLLNRVTTGDDVQPAFCASRGESNQIPTW